MSVIKVISETLDKFMGLHYKVKEDKEKDLIMFDCNYFDMPIFIDIYKDCALMKVLINNKNLLFLRNEASEQEYYFSLADLNRSNELLQYVFDSKERIFIARYIFPRLASRKMYGLFVSAVLEEIKNMVVEREKLIMAATINCEDFAEDYLDYEDYID